MAHVFVTSVNASTQNNQTQITVMGTATGNVTAIQIFAPNGVEVKQNRLMFDPALPITPNDGHWAVTITVSGGLLASGNYTVTAWAEHPSDSMDVAVPEAPHAI